MSHLIEDADLCCHDERVFGMINDVSQQRRGRSHHIGNIQDRACAFRMGQHNGGGISILESGDLLQIKRFVHLAVTIPTDDVASGVLVQPLSEMFVGPKHDGHVRGQGGDHVFGICRRTDQVRHGLDLKTAVHIAHHGMTGMGVDEGLVGLGWTLLDQRAAGIERGEDDDLVRVQQLGCLRHEPNTGQQDHVGFGTLRFKRKLQTVADHVGNILYFRTLVVVGQDHGVPALFDGPDLCDYVTHRTPN